MTDPQIDTYRARRRLEMAPGVFREPGELVPEAHDWFRLDSWLHTGFLEEAKVEAGEFRDAVDNFCSDQADKLLELAGLAKGFHLDGPRKTPVKTVAAKPSKSAPKLSPKAPKAPAEPSDPELVVTAEGSGSA